MGYLRHSFIAGFPTERVPKMPLSGVSARSSRDHDDGPVHPPGGLPAGEMAKTERLGRCRRLGN